MYTLNKFGETFVEQMVTKFETYFCRVIDEALFNVIFKRK